jgi:hypothetical protein
VPNLHISGNPFDFFFVYASMAHPQNELHRDEFVASLITRVMTEENCEFEIETPVSVLRVLLNAPSLEEIVKRASDAARKGSVAGDLLCFVAEMCMTGCDRPSIRKAIYMTEGYFSNALDGHGKEFSAKRSFIYECWKEYKSVAHLWAAKRVCLLSPSMPSLYETLFGDDLAKFLAFAEAFRIFGENYIQPYTKPCEPLLPHQETWKVPEGFTLPKVNLWIEELPEWMIERLKTYKSTDR